MIFEVFTFTKPQDQVKEIYKDEDLNDEEGERVSNDTTLCKEYIGMKEPEINKKKEVGVNIGVKHMHEENVNLRKKENLKRTYKRRIVSLKRKRLEMRDLGRFHSHLKQRRSGRRPSHDSFKRSASGR